MADLLMVHGYVGGTLRCAWAADMYVRNLTTAEGDRYFWLAKVHDGDDGAAKIAQEAT